MGTPRPNETKPLVLLVDDDEDSRFLYTHYLTSSAGFSVAEASNGRDAVALAAELAPAVIVMDITLPIMDGWQALRALRDDPRTERIPVVALTGHSISRTGTRSGAKGADPSDETGAGEDAQGGGFDAVLVKPCLPEVLAKSVQSLLAPGASS